MADFHHGDDQGAVVNLVEDAVVTLPDAVLFVAAQFDATAGTRVSHQRLDFGTTRWRCLRGSDSISFAAEGLMSNS